MCTNFLNEGMNISHSLSLLGSGTNDTAHENQGLLDKTELGQGRKRNSDKAGKTRRFLVH